MSFSFTKILPATGSVAIFELKERLKAAGWVVQASGDASSHFPSTDGITTGIGGAGGMANTNAWFRIREPSGTKELTFQRGTTNLLWRVKHSRAGFSTGSPSATQTPQAADQVTRFGGGTDASPTFGTIFATDGGYRWNIGADDAAPFSFWAGSFPSGGGAPNGAILYDHVTPIDVTDSDTSVLYIAASGQGPFVGYSSPGLCGETMTATTYIAGGYAPSAGAGASMIFAVLGYLTNNNNNAVPGQATDPIGSKDIVLPVFWQRRGVISGNFKGTSQVLRWCGTARTTGDTISVAQPRDRIVYGDFSLPWDGSVPTL